MHRNKKLLIIAVLCALIAAICFGLWINKTFYSKELIYSKRYWLPLGSRGVQIYNNGEVYDDLEIENPNHEVNYKYVKTLTAEQVERLKVKIAQGSEGKELSDFVWGLVYGEE